MSHLADYTKQNGIMNIVEDEMSLQGDIDRVSIWARARLWSVT